MRNSERSIVEISESSFKHADVQSAMVVGPTASVFGCVNPQFPIPGSDVPSPAPFRPGQYEILPQGPPRPVFRF